MIHVSPTALSEIKRLQSKQNPDTALRLGVKKGGCAGWFYDLSFDDSFQEDDLVLDVQSMRVIVDAASWDFLSDLVLDYSEDLMGGGFRFHNPQATATCGCGNSFSTTAAQNLM